MTNHSVRSSFSPFWVVFGFPLAKKAFTLDFKPDLDFSIRRPFYLFCLLFFLDLLIWGFFYDLRLKCHFVHSQPFHSYLNMSLVQLPQYYISL